MNKPSKSTGTQPERGTTRPPNELAKPIFIVGCMHSGTTFLANKLAQHPQLFKIRGDLHKEWTKFGGAPCSGTCAYRGKAHATEEYAQKMTDIFAEQIKQNRTFKDRILGLLTHNPLKGDRSENMDSSTIPINRSPHLINKLGYIQALFPRSKTILVVRDTLAQCASFKKQLDHELNRNGRRHFIPEDPKGCWSSWHSGGGEPDRPCYPYNLSALPKMWLRLNDLALEELKGTPRNSHLIISYESLTLELEKTLRSVFEFLNLKPDNIEHELKICRSGKDPEPYVLEKKSITNWKQQLTQPEIEEIDTVINSDRPRYERIMAAARNTDP